MAISVSVCLFVFLFVCLWVCLALAYLKKRQNFTQVSVHDILVVVARFSSEDRAIRYVVYFRFCG